MFMCMCGCMYMCVYDVLVGLDISRWCLGAVHVCVSMYLYSL